MDRELETLNRILRAENEKLWGWVHDLEQQLAHTQVPSVFAELVEMRRARARELAKTPRDDQTPEQPVNDWVRRELASATRQYLTDSSPDILNPADGFVTAYETEAVDSLVAKLCETAAPAGISVSRIEAMRVCEREMRDAARKRGEVAIAQAHSDRAQALTELLASAPAVPTAQQPEDALAALDRAQDVLSKAVPGDYTAYLEDDCEIIRRRLLETALQDTDPTP